MANETGDVLAEVNDATIIAESLRRPEVFAELFDRHYPTVYRYLAARVGIDVAEDLAAEVFLQAFDHRRRYDLSRPQARPWLLGVATNLVSHHRRAEARMLRALARTGVAPMSEDHATHVVERVVAEASSRTIAGALASMPARDRDVLLLVAWADLSYQEISATLGVPVGTVRSRLHRARTQLQAVLGGAGTKDQRGRGNG